MPGKRRVFLFAPFYLDLYKDIVIELEKTYHVYIFEDKAPQTKYGLPDTLLALKKALRFLHKRIFNNSKKHWEHIFNTTNEFGGKYDIFFCINGYTFHPAVIEHLRKNNPGIKTVLYLWDTTRYSDFSPIFKYFQRVLTFDRNDSKKYNIDYLPFYYVDRDIGKKNVNATKGVFFIGSNHDDRYWIIKKVISELEKTGHPYYIKLLVPDGKIPTVFSWLEFMFYKIFNKKDKYEYWNVYYGKYTPGFVINKPVPPAIYDEIQDRYDCVMDTERPGQIGVTFRIIWALAKNKKIITTNKNISDEIFYKPENILIIDRENPAIPKHFLDKTVTLDAADKLSALRIDNWIKTVFSG